MIRSNPRRLSIHPDAGGLAVWGKPDLDDADGLCLFVHGYNVEAMDAQESAETLLDTISRDHQLPSILRSRLWSVYWKGYAEGLFSHDKSRLSPLTYWSQIEAARQSGRVLADYLAATLGQSTAPIYIIGHSLGCRVVLEMLTTCARQYPQFDARRLPLVALMAAAVPLQMIESLNTLWRGALLPARTLVLFSPVDWVLSRAVFGTGQTIAGEGRFPAAVGRTGRPVGFWSSTVATTNAHSGYFTDRLTARALASEFSAARVRIDSPRVIPEHGTEDARGVAARDVRLRSVTERRAGWRKVAR